MSDLIRDYESFELMNMASVKFIEQGKTLNDALENVLALNKVANRCHSEEALSFISERFSLEADAAGGTGTTGTSKLKQTVGKAKAKVAGISSAVMNKTRGLLGKIKAYMKNARDWFLEFYQKSEIYAKRVAASLTASVNDLENSKSNINLKLKGICTSPQDVQITAILSQISSAKSKDDTSRIIDTMKSTYGGKIPQDEQEFSKEDVVGLGRQYIEAITRSINDKKAASTFFTNTADKAADAKSEEEMALTSVHTTAAMEAAQYTVHFVLQNATALDNAIRRGMTKNG